MKKYLVCVDTYACASYEVEANSPEEAEDKVYEMIDKEDFFDTYRKDCDFFEPTTDYIQEM